MRLFQNGDYYSGFTRRLRELSPAAVTFADHIGAYLATRVGAVHQLEPIEARAPWAFYTNAGDRLVQGLWAREHGVPATASAADILRAQIEDHRADVFYNHDPETFDSNFVRTLPGCVKVSIAWQASPYRADFSAYDLMVCNFPGILAQLRADGCRTAEFFPGHDPAMDAMAKTDERPVDLIFFGVYSRQHMRRAHLLEAIARQSNARVEFRLFTSRLTRLAETPLGLLPPLDMYRRPAVVAKIAKPPVFGIDMYQAVARAKIVFNAHAKIAGDERGNMRCFEAMGCGALLLSDVGTYPAGMSPGDTMIAYGDADDAVARIGELLSTPERTVEIARAGHAMVSSLYSKDAQWARFEQLAGLA